MDNSALVKTATSPIAADSVVTMQLTVTKKKSATSMQSKPSPQTRPTSQDMLHWSRNTSPHLVLLLKTAFQPTASSLSGIDSSSLSTKISYERLTVG